MYSFQNQWKSEVSILSTVYYPNKQSYKPVFDKKFPSLIYEGAPPAYADPFDYVKFAPKGVRLA